MEIQELYSNLYVLDEGRVRSFLIKGENESLLIDCGFADSQIMESVRQLTDTPVRLLLSHADPDHAGGIRDFQSAWLHPADWHLVRQPIDLHPLLEGNRFSCGGYHLEVIEIPGHTHGAVAFADFEKKLLISGDSVQRGGPIFLFGSHRNIKQYIQSEEKLAGMENRFEIILSSHHQLKLDPHTITQNLEDAKLLQAGLLKGTPVEGRDCKLYKGIHTEFYAD